MNKNNNIATIYHDRHDQLKLLAGSPAKAEFLSKCIYWWQISKYKIKNSTYIWFTRTTDELAAGAGLSESSVGRYLRDFADKGLIEKRVLKRYSKKHGQDIACLHIRITDKLLAILRTDTPKQSTTNQTSKKNENADSKNLRHIDDTPSVNVTVPTINNKENFLNNNISIVSQDDVNYGNKQQASFEKTIFPIEKEIGERISEQFKDKIKGMLFNVLKQQGQELKRHERLFTEVLFSVTNTQQFKGITDMNHRINIAASLIRKKKWKTPKGFYNHWDIGQAFKERDEEKRRRMQQEKLDRELLGVTDPKQIADIKSRFAASFDDESRFDKKRQTTDKPERSETYLHHLTDKLNQINNNIFNQGNFLSHMQDALKQGAAYASQELIDDMMIKLEKLYDEQADVERKLHETHCQIGLCA